MQNAINRGLLFLAPLLLISPALAQWSSDPAVNLAVGDAASDQNQVKMMPAWPSWGGAPSGGVWMSWFDGIGSGWDVRLQLLSRAGVEIFPHGGILVADRSFSSTQDYGLGVAYGGNALISYRDDSSGSTEIAANRISEGGTLLWGPNGVALTSGAGFVASPKIANLTSPANPSACVVAWTENSTVKLMRLDGLGAPLWPTPVTLTAPSGSYLLSDIKGSYGEVVVSMVHQTGGFTSPKHLVAQRFDADGAPQWGATPLPIFDGGSLQFGNFPEMLQGPAGGVIFAWYSASPALQCFVQRVDAAGVESWAHNGVAVADVPGQLRVNPHATYYDGNDSVYVTWKEQNGSQSQSGISAQRLDASGNRMWGSAGTVIEPLGSADHNMARILHRTSGDLALVAWSSAPSFGNDQLYAAILDSTGAIDVPRFDVASTPSGKARMAIVESVYSAVLAWSDARNDGGDIYAQAVSFEGNLEAPFIGSPFCFPGYTNSMEQSAELTGDWITGGGIGGGLSDLHLEITGGPPNQLGYFLIGTQATPGQNVSNGLFCLIGMGSQFFRYNVGGTSMNSVGGFNASGILVNAAGTSSTGTGFDVPSAIPASPPVAITAGSTWHFQGWYRDTAAGAGSSNFSNGLSVTF